MTPSKVNIGKTNKYSGVVKSIKATKPPEEPRIRPDQVLAAFHSFGFVPNERNHNDIAYWTSKGQSEGPKLIEELHKRRMDINKGEDEKKKSETDKQKLEQKIEDNKKKAHEDILNKQHTDKAAMPRLSDHDINSLFDEYGLPTPDPEWARSHLPNDPKKIRSILEMQRKMADDMLKKHSKNTVNSIPEVPKASGTGGPYPVPMAGTGQGGPSPVGMQGGMMQQGDSPSTPFFVGDNALVRITQPHNPNSSTLWLVDSGKKVLRPFMSDQAFHNAFEDPSEAEKAIVTLSSKDLGPGGILEGFTPLQGKQGINHDGSMEKIEFSPGQIQKRYGKPSDPTAENKSLSMLDGILGQINRQPKQ